MPSIADITDFHVMPSSDGMKTYQVLKYKDGSLSCDCPGWTKRCVNGVRTCKHVRLVQAGCAAQYRINGKGTPLPANNNVKDQPEAAGARRFNFED